jgi:hypothetical protein
MASPEAIASMLVAALAFVVVASQLLSRPEAGGSASAPPASSNTAVATTSAQPMTSMPPLIRSALSTILIVNRHLASRIDELDAAIGAKKPTAEGIATILRNINTDMAAGRDSANQLLTEHSTEVLGNAVLDFYQSVGDQNAATLGASLHAVALYVDGARKVIRILSGLRGLDARVRSALASSGEAPPSASPASASPGSSSG